MLSMVMTKSFVQQLNIWLLNQTYNNAILSVLYRSVRLATILAPSMKEISSVKNSIKR